MKFVLLASYAYESPNLGGCRGIFQWPRPWIICVGAGSDVCALRLWRLLVESHGNQPNSASRVLKTARDLIGV